MLSLFYRLKLLNYVLSNLKELAVKLFLLVAYLYTSSIILMFLSNGFWYAVEFCSLKNAFYHLYQYLKWYYDNINDLGYGISFRIIVAFVTPNLVYKSFCGVDSQSPFLKKLWKIFGFLSRKKGKEVPSANKSNFYNPNSEVFLSTDNDYYNETQDPNYEKVCKIKYLLMRDIVQAVGQIPELSKIDKTIAIRLYKIFLSNKDKSH